MSADDAGLMPWSEVARRLGVSPRVARRLCESALAKLRVALKEYGVTDEVVAAYFAMKDDRRITAQANLAAILPDVEPPKDEDVSKYRSLRSAR